jgi:hypothetical protein
MARNDLQLGTTRLVEDPSLRGPDTQALDPLRAGVAAPSP